MCLVATVCWVSHTKYQNLIDNSSMYTADFISFVCLFVRVFVSLWWFFFNLNYLFFSLVIHNVVAAVRMPIVFSIYLFLLQSFLLDEKKVHVLRTPNQIRFVVIFKWCKTQINSNIELMLSYDSPRKQMRLNMTRSNPESNTWSLPVLRFNSTSIFWSEIITEFFFVRLLFFLLALSFSHSPLHSPSLPYSRCI